MDIDQFEMLLGEIYESAWSTSQWSTVLNRLAQMTNCTIAHLYVSNHRTRKVVESYCGGDEGRISSAHQAYIDYYGAIDPRGAKSSSLTPGDWILCQEHFDERYVSRSEFYQDYLIPNGFRYGTGTSLLVSSNIDISFGLLDEGQAFSREKHLPMLNRITPHLQRSMKLGQRLQQQAGQIELGSYFIDKLAQPVIVCSSTGKVIYSNRGADALLAVEHCIRIEKQHLVCANVSHQQRLSALIRGASSVNFSAARQCSRASKAEPGIMTTRSLRNGRNLHLSILPVPQSHGVHADFAIGQGALILFDSPQGDFADIEYWLTSLYRCSPAEVRIAKLLLDGLSPEEIGLSLGLKLPTVRTHLRNLFDKTGTSRQTALVRLMASLPTVGIIGS
jgi:DNA-binding CsgD family transcriptional regulator